MMFISIFGLLYVVIYYLKGLFTYRIMPRKENYTLNKP